MICHSVLRWLSLGLIGREGVGTGEQAQRSLLLSRPACTLVPAPWKCIHRPTGVALTGIKFSVNGIFNLWSQPWLLLLRFCPQNTESEQGPSL